MTQIEKYWFTDLDNLAKLARYIVDKDSQESLDIVYFLEKPWKWESEWIAYQNEQQINEGLDAFDRREK